jgi:hypothetical protein
MNHLPESCGTAAPGCAGWKSGPSGPRKEHSSKWASALVIFPSIRLPTAVKRARAFISRRTGWRDLVFVIAGKNLTTDHTDYTDSRGSKNDHGRRDVALLRLNFSVKKRPHLLKNIADRSRPRLRSRILWHRHSCLCLPVGCTHSRPSMTCPAWSRHPERRCCARDWLRCCRWFTNPLMPCHVERSTSTREGESKHPENVSNHQC